MSSKGGFGQSRAVLLRTSPQETALGPGGSDGDEVVPTGANSPLKHFGAHAGSR